MIKELENFCLWQRLNSFLLIFFLIRLSSKTFDSFNIDYIVFHLKWIKKFFFSFFDILSISIEKKRKENDNVEKNAKFKGRTFFFRFSKIQSYVRKCLYLLVITYKELLYILMYFVTIYMCVLNYQIKMFFI